MTAANPASSPPMGFAGISALATALPPEVAVAPITPKPATAIDTAAPVARAESHVVEAPVFWTAGRRWAATLTCFIAVIAALNLLGDTSHRYPSSSSYSPSPPTSPASRPAYEPAPVIPVRQDVESKPPAVLGQTLGRAEIRYCLSERVRVEAMSDYIDTTSDNHIGRYNAVVADYNARCSNYRYRESDMNAVKASVDASGAVLKAQAASTVRQWR